MNSLLSQLKLADFLSSNQSTRNSAQQKQQQLISNHPQLYVNILCQKLKQKDQTSFQILFVLINRLLIKKKHSYLFVNNLLDTITIFYYQLNINLLSLQKLILPVFQALLKRVQIKYVTKFYNLNKQLINRQQNIIQYKGIKLMTVIVQVVRKKGIVLNQINSIDLRQILTWPIKQENKNSLCSYILELIKLKKEYKLEFIQKLLYLDSLQVIPFLKENQKHFSTWQQKKNLVIICANLIKKQASWQKLQCDVIIDVSKLLKQSLGSYFDKCPLKYQKRQLLGEEDICYLFEWSFKVIESWPQSDPLQSCSMSIHDKIFYIFNVLVKQQNIEVIVEFLKKMQWMILNTTSNYNLLCYEFLGIYLKQIKQKLSIINIVKKAISDILQNKYSQNQLIYEFLIQYSQLDNNQGQKVRNFVIGQLKKMSFRQVRSSMKIIFNSGSINCLSQYLLFSLNKMTQQQKCICLRNLWNLLLKYGQGSELKNSNIFDNIFALIDNDFNYNQDYTKIQYLWCLMTSLKINKYSQQIMIKIWEFLSRFSLTTYKLNEQILASFFMWVRRINLGGYNSIISQKGYMFQQIIKKIIKNSDLIKSQYCQTLIIQIVSLRSPQCNDFLFKHYFQIAYKNLELRQHAYQIIESILIISPQISQNNQYAKIILDLLRNQPQYFRFYFRFKIVQNFPLYSKPPSKKFQLKWYILSYINWGIFNILKNKQKIQKLKRNNQLDHIKIVGNAEIFKTLKENEFNQQKNMRDLEQQNNQKEIQIDDLEIIKKFQKLNINDGKINECLKCLQNFQENEDHWLNIHQQSTFKQILVKDRQQAKVINLLRGLNLVQTI